MKLSTKLNKKIGDLSVSIHNFSKKINEASDTVKDLSELVSAGDAARKFSDKEVEKALRKFNKIKSYCMNFAEEASDISDDLESVGAQIDSEIKEVGKTADDVEGKVEEAAQFSRKMRILTRRFSGISNDLNDIVTEATSVVNMKPEEVVKVAADATTTEAESITPKDGEAANGAELTTQKTDTQTPAASVVNFSHKNYVKFAANSIIKSFAQIVDDVEESEEAAKDLDEISQEPEVAPAEGNTEPAPETTSSPTTEVTPEGETTMENPAPEVPATETAEDSPPSQEAAEATEENDADSLADEVLEFGEEAIMSGSDAAADELTQKLEDLEAKTPGKGEEVMAKLENFSANLKKFKSFSTVSVFDKIKEFTEGACKAAVEKNIDTEDLGSKAEDLEKNQPGAGELLTSVLECFGKLIDAIKVPTAAGAPVKPSFCAKNFCGDIDKFVEDIDVADKKFAREIKTKCFALEDAIDDGDTDKIKETSNDLATSLDKANGNDVITSFGEKLVKFAEDLVASSEATETAENADTGVPENISKADDELNQVIDKLSEKGEHLKPEVVAFAKKLCSAYKDMKCFTEEDLDAKLEKIESLKKDFDDNVAPETPSEPVAPAPEVKPEVETESNLIIEEETPKNELPSDASLQNFSSTPLLDDDPLGHLASLEIR